MRDVGPVRWRLGATPAEVEASKPYLGEARVQLGIMKNLMAMGNQQQGMRAVTLPDGTVIRSQSVMGQNTVQITPTAAAVQAAASAMTAVETTSRRIRVAGVVDDCAAYWDYHTGTVVVSEVTAASADYVHMSRNGRYIAVWQWQIDSETSVVWDTLTGDVSAAGVGRVYGVTDDGVAVGSVQADMGRMYGVQAVAGAGAYTYSNAFTSAPISQSEYEAEVFATENSPFAADHYLIQYRAVTDFDAGAVYSFHSRTLINWISFAHNEDAVIATSDEVSDVPGRCEFVSRHGGAQVQRRTAAYVRYYNIYDAIVSWTDAGTPREDPVTSSDAQRGERVFVTGIGVVDDSAEPLALSASGVFAVVLTNTFTPQVDYLDAVPTLLVPGGTITGTATSVNLAGSSGPNQFVIFNTVTGGSDTLNVSGDDGSYVTAVDDAGFCYGYDGDGNATKVFSDGMRQLSGLFHARSVTHNGAAVLGQDADNRPAIFIGSQTVSLPVEFTDASDVASF